MEQKIMDNMINNSNKGSSLEDINSFQDTKEKAIILELNKFLNENKNILKKNEEEIKGLYRTITDLKVAESKKTKTINSLNEKINQINKENEDSNIKILNYEKEIKNYLEEIANLKDLSSKYVIESEGKDDLIKKQDIKIEKLESAIIESKDLELKKNEEIKDLLQQIVNISDELSEKEKNLNDIHNELKDKNALAEQQYAVLKTNEVELEELQATLKEKNNLINEQEQKLNDFENLNKIINEKTNKLKEFQETIDYLSKELSEKKQSLYDMQDELSSKESIIQESVKIKDELQKLKNTLDDQKKLQEIVRNLKSDNNELQDKNRELENRIKEVLHEINNLKEDTSDIEAQKKRMESELQKFNYSLELKENELKGKENKLNELENLITKLKNDSNNNDINQLSKGKELLTEKLNDLDSLILKKDKEITDLQGEIKKISKQLKEKLFNEEQLSSIVDNQAQKIVDLESKITLFTSKEYPAEKKEQPENQELENNTISVENEIEKNEEDSISIMDEKAGDSSISAEASKDDEIIVNDQITLKCESILSETIKNSSESGSIEHFQYGEISVIEINISRATLEIAALLRNFLNKIINQKYNNLIVDMSNCEFVDSTILGVLVSMLKKAKGINGDLKIVWSEQKDTSMFYVTRMDKVFMIYDNLNEAVKSYF